MSRLAVILLLALCPSCVCSILAHIPLFSGTVIPSALSSPTSPAVRLPLSLARSRRSHLKQPGHSAPSTGGVCKDILFSLYFCCLNPGLFVVFSPCVQRATGRETLFFDPRKFLFFSFSNPVTEEVLKTIYLIFLDFCVIFWLLFCGPDYSLCCSLKSLI